MRALCAGSLAYFASSALGKTAGIDGVEAAVSDFGFFAGFASAVLGAAGVAAGVAAASLPHCSLRKSFHFWPPSVPAVSAALYLALHSCMVSACAGIATAPAKAKAAIAAPIFTRVIIFFSLSENSRT